MLDLRLVVLLAVFLAALCAAGVVLARLNIDNPADEADDEYKGSGRMLE